jgi:hypothetical protein
MTNVPTIAEVAQGVAILGALGAGLYFANARTLKYYENKPHLQFRRQLIMLGLTIAAVLIAIILVPTEDELQKNLLNLFGIVLSATIALSSTTLIGNAMAGIMLRTTQSCRPGDYVHVGEHFGRISEMDLLHTEIQTEERDLTTLPNMYMVTNPIRTLRKSGTILVVEVSLGYDVPRHEIEVVLKEAATRTGLESPYVQIRGLGDYSVSYAIAGLLTDLTNLIKKRRQLRAHTMDLLHEAGIEIASPSLHSVRDFPMRHAFIPKPGSSAEDPEGDASIGPDDLVFDKANQAENLETLRDAREQLGTEIAELDNALKGEMEDDKRATLGREKERLERRVLWVTKQITRLESRIAEE